MSESDGGSAFPLDVAWVINPGKRGLVPPTDAKGMTLRDYFAAAALTGVLQARALLNGPDALGSQESVAEECYELADALLEERVKPGTASERRLE